MVRVTFSWCGVGPIARIKKFIAQYQFRSLMKNVFEPYSFDSMPFSYIFQHGNELTSRFVKCWLSVKILMFWTCHHKIQISTQLKINGQLLKEILGTKTLEITMNYFSGCNKAAKTYQFKYANICRKDLLMLFKTILS